VGDDEKIMIGLERVHRRATYLCVLISSYSGQELGDVHDGASTFLILAQALMCATSRCPGRNRWMENVLLRLRTFSHWIGLVVQSRESGYDGTNCKHGRSESWSFRIFENTCSSSSYHRQWPRTWSGSVEPRGRLLLRLLLLHPGLEVVTLYAALRQQRHLRSQ